ncbi:Adenosylhomocysteinase [uncultured archaeon]|nr:Adenosylhomocysteinase [uncultured archaeon]
MSRVKDKNLAPQGRLKIEWAVDHMPVLSAIEAEFSKDKPLKGIRVGFALHVTKETAVLVNTLKAAGAEVAIASCNPLSTQDDVAASLAKDGVEVFAWRGENTKEYYENIASVLDSKPHITVDDGGDLVFMVHKERTDLIKGIKGGCEETTTGVIRLRAMEKDGVLKYPVFATNDADTKHMFDNHYGTGQSSLDGVLRATNILFAGKTVVVAGYGWCGRGIAARARGMGSHVIVTEVDPILALRAAMDGFTVKSMDDAAPLGDAFITATGNVDVITERHFKKMKAGAVLANAGHFNNEVSIPDLEKLAKSKKEMRPNVERYELQGGRHIYLLAEGRLVNLAAAEGHPSEVMDMSFANQALAVRYIAEHKMKPGVHEIPRDIDERVARMKIASMGITIDGLSDRQKKYLSSWDEGT